MSFRLSHHWVFNSSWNALDPEFQPGYPNNAIGRLDRLLTSRESFYPDPGDIFKAYRCTPLDTVNVVILGQDPYHDGNATGLAFSVKHTMTPSLGAIYDAIEADLDRPPARTGNLTPWTEDGVLLLNTVLTVDPRNPGSHAGAGWEEFTRQTIKVINSDSKSPVIFMLWGERAWASARLVDTTRHFVLPAAHPRANNARLRLSRSRHFSITNHLLRAHGHKQVRWLRV